MLALVCLQPDIRHTQEKLKRAETAAAIAEHAFEELQRRSELDEAGLQEEKGKRRHRRAHEQIQGAKQGKENEDTGATSADTVSDFEDDSVGGFMFLCAYISPSLSQFVIGLGSIRALD